MGNGPEQAYKKGLADGKSIIVTPDTLWPIAQLGTLQGKGQTVLPIVRVALCPATVTVTQTEFPQGVILLNDFPPPQSVEPVAFLYKEYGGPSAQVPICADAGWPWCNIVVLWG